MSQALACIACLAFVCGLSQRLCSKSYDPFMPLRATAGNRGVGLVPAQFECPCHGSKFDAQGRVLTGPATRALERVRLTLASDERVVVDCTAIVNVDFRLAI